MVVSLAVLLAFLSGGALAVLFLRRGLRAREQEGQRLRCQLAEAEDALRRADRLAALGALSAGLAHEIRNPLVAIRTFFQLAPRRLEDEEFLRSFLPIAADEVDRVNDLLDHWLVQAREPREGRGPVSLPNLLSALVTLLRPELRRREVSCDLDLPSSLPEIPGDADALRQCFLNLLRNAVEVSPPGSHVRVSATVEEGSVQVGIEDSGPGVPNELRTSIFAPGFTTREDGNGLGLAIVARIVAEHAGQVRVEDAEHGARFEVVLPRSV